MPTAWVAGAVRAAATSTRVAAAVLVRFVRDLWFSIHEPRVTKTIYAITYLIATGIGAVTLRRPPTSIETPLGPTLTAIWGALILIGALAAIVAVFPGWWWLERLGILCIAAGALIYFVVVVILHVQSGPESSRLTQAGVILGFAWSVSAARLWDIRGYTFEPRGR